MEVTNQTVQATAPTNSAAPTGYAPTVASQYATSQPQVSPASMGQAPAPQMPQYQASAQAQQASAPEGNPWQTAFQALSASLNSGNQYQAQASPSAYLQTPTPQATTQPNWTSQPQYQVAPQTSSPQVSTPSYSASEVQALMQQAVQQQTAAAPRQESVAASDAYLSGISDASLEVLEHFGAEAPAMLNQYACAVEDALIEQVQRGNSMSLTLEAAGEEHAATNLILTNPDVLADYVNEFFGPSGPYPTNTPEEQQYADQAAARAQFEQEILAQEQNNVPQNFQRPQMNMPTPGRQAQQAGDFWGNFSEMMDSSPENAWKYLTQAPQGALQAKALVQDL